MDTNVKKEPPKFIEKIIDKVEEALVQPANSPKQSKKQPQQTKQQQKEVSEVALPKGTTITLPDGKTFETKTVSKLSKEGPA